MATVTITLNDAVKEVISGQRRAKRAVTNLVFSIPGAKAFVFNSIQKKLAEDDEASTLGLQPVVSASGFNRYSAFQIDIDKLEQFLELLAKWIPIFIALFATKGTGILLIVFGLLAGSAATAEDAFQLVAAKRTPARTIAAEPIHSLTSAIHAARTATVYAAMARGQEAAVYRHLVSEHGYSANQVESLSLTDALMLHNLAHGPYRNALIGGRRNASQTVARTVSVTTGNCANGQCSRATSRNVFSNGGFVRRLFAR